MRVAFGEPFDVPVGYLNTAVTGVPPQRVVTAVGEVVAAWSQGRVQPADLEPAVTAAREGFARLVGVPCERVAIGDPGYPSYRNTLRALDLAPVAIATRAEDRYQPVPSDLTPDLAGVLVASPANPTGTMLGRGELAASRHRTDSGPDRPGAAGLA